MSVLQANNGDTSSTHILSRRYANSLRIKDLLGPWVPANIYLALSL